MSRDICRRSVVALMGVAVAFTTSLPTRSAWAGEITEFATNADDLLQQGKPAEALGAFDKAANAFWAQSPLQVRTALFVKSVQGFGQYEPRDDGAFHSGEDATLYVEPVGYGFTGGSSLFAVTFKAGIEIQTAGGIVLAEAEDFGRLRWEGRTMSHAVHLAIDVTLPELKPGDYRLITTLTDTTTAKETTVALPFSIVE